MRKTRIRRRRARRRLALAGTIGAGAGLLVLLTAAQSLGIGPIAFADHRWTRTDRPAPVMGPPHGQQPTTGDETTPDAGAEAPTAVTSGTVRASDVPESTTPPRTTTAATEAPTGVAGPIVAANGEVDAAAYRRMASAMGTEAGIAYRFGAPASTAGAPGAPTAFQPADKVLKNADRADQAYQVGGPQDDSKNDYSSNQGQVGYLSAGSATFGADTVETLAMGENTFSEKPQLSWTFNGGGHPAVDLVGDGVTARCLADLKVKPGRFVAQARAYAHGEATANSLMVFDNGVIAAAGTNTAPGRTCLQLPAELHPTAISLTNGNEFALVTVWNTTSLRAELAVIALGGSQPTGQFWNNEFSQLYPGFQNYGMPTFSKLLGTVPLPMATATGVSAVSDYSGGQWITDPGGANVNPGQLPLSDEANRQTFVDGHNSDKRSKAGYAVVFSREEHKVAFVDLQPLFDTITDAYFGDRATFDSVVGDVGQGASQWPRTFAVTPAEAPKVVRTVTMEQAPTAAAGLLSGAATPRAYVATADGTLHVFDVGGLASSQAVDPSGIAERGTIPVGKNPTSITYTKDRPLNTKGLDSTLIVTARGSQAVQWVTLSGDSGSVTRTLRDSRIVDPIAAEDNNTHGTESWVVSVADFGAERLLNFRYGRVVLHTNGGQAFGIGGSGSDEFEFGGSYDPKGKPFSISLTNVT